MQKKVQIGIIDPDTSVLQIVQNIIKGENYDCNIFTNPEDAIKKVCLNPYNLIIAEWEFPSFNGKDLYKSISEKIPNIPFIFLTNVRDPEIRLKAIQIGAIDYVTKPFDRSYLLAKIKSVISILSKNKKEQNNDPDSYSDMTTSLIEHFKKNNIQDIIPKPDISSQNGFSYDLDLIWPNDSIPQDKRFYYLEKAFNEGKLEKRIYNIIHTCSNCKSSQLNLRFKCEVCQSPCIIPNSSFTKHICRQCSSEFEIVNKYYFCVACSFEFTEKESIPKYIYSYHLQRKNQQKSDKILESLAKELKLKFFAGELFDPFYRLEKQQHEIIQQPFAMLRMKFSLVSSNGLIEKSIKNISHVILILKKMLVLNHFVFIHNPNMLTVFFPSTNFKDAEEIEQRLRSYLERLELNQSVDLQLISNDLENTLKFLETDSSTGDQLP